MIEKKPLGGRVRGIKARSNTEQIEWLPFVDLQFRVRL